MIDDIYDNGEILLGKVKWVKEYIKKHAMEMVDTTELDDLLQELDDLKGDTIVAVNYDNPMGYDIKYWTYEDRKYF